MSDRAGAVGPGKVQAALGGQGHGENGGCALPRPPQSLLLAADLAPGFQDALQGPGASATSGACSQCSWSAWSPTVSLGQARAWGPVLKRQQTLGQAAFSKQLQTPRRAWHTVNALGVRLRGLRQMHVVTQPRPQPRGRPVSPVPQSPSWPLCGQPLPTPAPVAPGSFSVPTAPPFLTGPHGPCRQGWQGAVRVVVRVRGRVCPCR